MTIDERLDRLVERHEALTESLQLLKADAETLLAVTRSHERRLTRLEGEG